MKKDIHPSGYREVVFEDISSGATIQSDKVNVTTTYTIKCNGGAVTKMREVIVNLVPGYSDY